MNKERKPIESNAIVVFNEDITASELIKLIEDFNGDVVVNGTLFLDDHITMKCNLYVSNIENMAFGGCVINCERDLYCFGDINNPLQINVRGILWCKGNIDCRGIHVNEGLYCNSNIIAYHHNVIVAGDFECNSIESAKLSVWGTMNIRNTLSIS